jgi:hypothetical protein
MSDKYFVLGADDAEMKVIKALLTQFGIPFVQPLLKAISKEIPMYTPEQAKLQIGTDDIGELGSPDFVSCVRFKGVVVEPVFIECRPTTQEWKGVRWLAFNPHDIPDGTSASIRIVIDLLEIWPLLSPATQRFVELVALMDMAGGDEMMRYMGATEEEMERVWALVDR